MKCLIYLTIFVATNCYANCRVANDEIVCDNSNTLIETYNLITKPRVYPQPVYVVNQPIQMLEIKSNYFPTLLEERIYEVLPKMSAASSNKRED